MYGVGEKICRQQEEIKELQERVDRLERIVGRLDVRTAGMIKFGPLKGFGNHDVE